MNDTNEEPVLGPPAIRRTRGQVTFDVSPNASSYYNRGDVILPEADRQLYKFLKASGISPYQNWSGWSLPTKNDDGTWTPGDWVEEPGQLVTCEKGLHLAYIVSDRLPTRLDSTTMRRFAGTWEQERVFVAEVDGPVLYSEEAQKYVAHRVRLVREVEGWRAYYSDRQNGSRSFPNHAEHLKLNELALARRVPLWLSAVRKAGYVTLARKLNPLRDNHADLLDAAKLEIRRLNRQIEIMKAEHKVAEAKRYLAWVKANKPVAAFDRRPYRGNREDRKIRRALEALELLVQPHYLDAASDTALFFGIFRSRYAYSRSYAEVTLRRSAAWGAKHEEFEAQHLADRLALRAKRIKTETFDELFPEVAA
jgi:hypothetical protein